VVRWPAAGDTAGSSLRLLSSLQHRIYNLLASAPACHKIPAAPLEVAVGYLDDLAARPAPPDGLDEPVGGGGRVCPALVREQQDARLAAARRAAAAAVVTQQLARAPAAVLVVVQLDHPPPRDIDHPPGRPQPAT